MENNHYTVAKNILDKYLADFKMRKTPERYAVLQACYEIKDLFSISDLNERINNINFKVSRATLYNTLRLFVSAGVIMRHNIGGETMYEPTYYASGHIRQICTICGKVTDISSSLINKTIPQMKLKRFHQEYYSLMVYGTCSTCQTKIKRRKTNT